MNKNKLVDDFLFGGLKPGEIHYIVARQGQGKSTLFPEESIIKLEDNIESWTSAMKKIHEAKKKGSEIVIDLSSIRDYTKQVSIRESINRIAGR